MAQEPTLKKDTERIKKAVENIGEQLFEQEWKIDSALYIDTTPF